VLGNRLIHPPALQRGVAEAIVRLDMVRVQLQGLPVLSGGLDYLPALQQGVAEAIVRVGIVGVDFQSLRERGKRLAGLASLDQRGAEVVVSEDVAGVDLQGLFEMPDCFIHSPSAQYDLPQVVMGDAVVRGTGERVAPQRLTTAPVRGLCARTCDQTRDYTNPRGPQHHPPPT